MEVFLAQCYDILKNALGSDMNWLKGKEVELDEAMYAGPRDTWQKAAHPYQGNIRDMLHILSYVYVHDNIYLDKILI